MGLLEQRLLQASDFNPDSINHPEAEIYSRGSLGLDLPFYEGGKKTSQLSLQTHLSSAQINEANNLRAEQYAEVAKSYGSILPMAFVRGLMGPYMKPIPVGASFAMILSLFVAFIVYIGIRLVQKLQRILGNHDADSFKFDRHLPGHAIVGSYFTATSMIGFIAGAGIIVRNSIIVVDFIEHQLATGMNLKDSVVSAGVLRFRPMLLTAAAVVVGSSVMITDPIFQGLAVSLIFGEVAATVLSRFAVPVLYYWFVGNSRARLIHRASVQN